MLVPSLFFKQHVKKERKGNYHGGVSSDTFDLQMISAVSSFQCISCELDRRVTDAAWSGNMMTHAVSSYY
jgi:hypothetical protein